MPEDDVFAALERLHAELDEVRRLLTGREASVRLVLTPEQVVLAEARRSYTTLSLFGYRVDGVVANRVFPAEDADPWRAGWVAAQTEVLDRGGRLVRGRAGLALAVPAVGAGGARGARGPRPTRCTPTATRSPYRRRRTRSAITRTSEGAVLHLRLPFVGRADVDLARDGDELVVTVGSYRRLLTLPAGLSRHRVTGARVDGGELQVKFAAERSED